MRTLTLAADILEAFGMTVMYTLTLYAILWRP